MLAAHAATHLGQGRVAVDWTETAHVDPAEFPLIAADLAYVRGMAYRQLGDEDSTQLWLTKATINGMLIGPAKEVSADRRLQLVVTDESAIDSRTDRWDAATEQSEQTRCEAENREKRAELFAEGRAPAGQPGRSRRGQARRSRTRGPDRGPRLAVGPRAAGDQPDQPHAAGRTTGEPARPPPPKHSGKIYAGLGIVRHPEVVEVKRADFCGEHIGSSGPKTNDLINRSLGRILFMDEFSSLVERHHDGRPDMIGMRRSTSYWSLSRRTASTSASSAPATSRKSTTSWR